MEFSTTEMKSEEPQAFDFDLNELNYGVSNLRIFLIFYF